MPEVYIFNPGTLIILDFIVGKKKSSTRVEGIMLEKIILHGLRVFRSIHPFSIYDEGDDEINICQGTIFAADPNAATITRPLLEKSPVFCRK